MQRRLKPIILIISLLVQCLFFSFPTFAANSTSSHITETVFFGNLSDDGSACGVFTILNLVVDVLSIGVGILALIAITIVGIKYLTAGGNEEQTKKAKRRMFQIIIGIVAYASIYSGLEWLMPGGKLNATQDCTTVSNEDLAKIKEKERAEAEAQRQSSEKVTPPKQNSNDSSTPKTNENKKGEPSALGKKILKEMKKTADEFERIGVTFDNGHGASTWNELYRTKKSHCSSYVFLTLKRMGLLSKAGDTYFWFTDYGKKLKKDYGSAIEDLAKNFVEIKGNDTIKNLVKKGKLVPGDICGDGAYKSHTIMYAGQSGGHYRIHSFGSGKFKKKNHYNIIVSGSHKIGRILHAK